VTEGRRIENLNETWGAVVDRFVAASARDQPGPLASSPRLREPGHGRSSGILPRSLHLPVAVRRGQLHSKPQ